MAQTTCKMEREITKTVRLNYLLHLPSGYESETEQKWPLIMFLHGRGERGDDVEKIRVHGIPKIVENQPDFPFVAVSPQCPGHTFWPVEHDALLALLDTITETYSIDEDRVYLTGLSMGGYGTWSFAAEYPDRFAAIVPVCGGGNAVLSADSLKTVPIWAFHGAKDTVVPLVESEQMVDAINAKGGNAKLTVYPEANHNSWEETYANPELYEWFLKHSRVK
jgi:predicted peptidase